MSARHAGSGEGEANPEEIIRDIEVQITRRVEKRYAEKIDLLKRSFEERLRQIADTLAVAGSRVAADTVIGQMSEDPASRQFVQVRAAEILQEELSLERERLVAALTQQLAEHKAENAELLRANRELGTRLQHHDSLVATDIEREASMRVDAEKRCVALHHECEMMRLAQQRTDEELAAAQAKAKLFAARDKAAHDAERIVQRQADDIETYRQREERTLIEHRAAIDRISLELAQSQTRSADLQRQVANLQRELDAAATRCAAADQQLPALKEALSARDRRLAAVEEKRTALADQCGILTMSLERSERERNELRSKYISVGDKVDELLKAEEAENAQALESVQTKARRLRDALVEERRARRRERAQLQAEVSDQSQKLAACTVELRAAEDAVRALQQRAEQAEARAALDRRTHAAAATAASEHAQHLDCELKAARAAAHTARTRIEQISAERDAAVTRAETALECRVRRADEELAAAQRALESRVDTEARKFQQRYQLDLESKLAEMRASYEARLAMERAREVQTKETGEQRLRDAEAQAIEARNVAIEARVVAVQAQCTRERTEALRRLEAEHAQALHEVRERSAAEYTQATDTLRAALRHSESALQSAQARASIAETAAQKAAHAAAELRSRVEIAESGAAEEMTARRTAAQQLDDTRRTLEHVRAQHDADAAKLRALERRQRLDIDEREDADEAVTKARKALAAAEQERHEAVLVAERATGALKGVEERRDDAERKLERTLAALTKCETERVAAAREAAAAADAATAAHEHALAEAETRAQRAADALAASEQTRTHMAAALGAAETALADARRDLAARDAVERSTAQRTLADAEARVQAAETRVQHTHAHADAVALKAEQNVLRCAQLERELLIAHQTLARVRSAAEASRRLFGALVGTQLAELRAECTQLRAALGGVWTSVAADAVRCVGDVAARARAASLAVNAEHEREARTAAHAAQAAAEQHRAAVDAAAASALREVEARATAQVRDAEQRCAVELEAMRAQHARLAADANDRISAERAAAAVESQALHRAAAVASAQATQFARAAEAAHARCASLVVCVAGECAVDVDIQRDLLLQSTAAHDSEALHAASSDEVAQQLVELRQREQFASALQRLRGALRASAATQAAALALQVSTTNEELRAARAQLTSSVGAQRDADERMQALRRQLAEAQIANEQRASTLESERAQLAMDRRAAATEVQRLKQEMQNMQQELLLAAELSQVNATQPYRAEVDSMRSSISSLEQSHRAQLDAKEREYAQRLAALRGTYEAELRAQRQQSDAQHALAALHSDSGDGGDDDASVLSDEQAFASAGASTAATAATASYSAANSSMRLLGSPSVRAAYPPAAAAAAAATVDGGAAPPVDTSLSASQLSGFGTSTLGLGLSGLGTSTLGASSRANPLRMSQEAARLRALTAAVSGSVGDKSY